MQGRRECGTDAHVPAKETQGRRRGDAWETQGRGQGEVEVEEDGAPPLQITRTIVAHRFRLPVLVEFVGTVHRLLPPQHLVALQGLRLGPEIHAPHARGQLVLWGKGEAQGKEGKGARVCFGTGRGVGCGGEWSAFLCKSGRRGKSRTPPRIMAGAGLANDWCWIGKGLAPVRSSDLEPSPPLDG